MLGLISRQQGVVITREAATRVHRPSRNTVYPHCQTQKSWVIADASASEAWLSVKDMLLRPDKLKFWLRVPVSECIVPVVIQDS